MNSIWNGLFILIFSIYPFFKMQIQLIIILVIFCWINLTHQGTIISFNCVGGGMSGVSTIRFIKIALNLPQTFSQYQLSCSPRNGPNPKCIVPPTAPNTLRATEGCEFDAAISGNYWCCPQYCPDGKTMIYYDDLVIRATSTVDKPKTAECTGPGICPTDSTMECYQPNPIDGRYFCCPPVNVPTMPNPKPPMPGIQNCEDIGGEDCLLKDYLCNNTLYFDLMTWQCPLTCNRCPADNSQPTRPPNIANPPLLNQNCKDMLDCPTWKKNGFCQNAFYSMDTKATMCPISCQLGCTISN